LRQVTAKPKHVPGDEIYGEIEKRIIDHLKRHGVETVTLRVGRSDCHAAPEAWIDRESQFI
jgi:hypothetical protein